MSKTMGMELRKKTIWNNRTRITMVNRKASIRMMRTSRSRSKNSLMSSRKNFYFCSSRPLKCRDIT